MRGERWFEVNIRVAPDITFSLVLHFISCVFVKTSWEVKMCGMISNWHFSFTISQPKTRCLATQRDGRLLFTRTMVWLVHSFWLECLFCSVWDEHGNQGNQEQTFCCTSVRFILRIFQCLYLSFIILISLYFKRNVDFRSGYLSNQFILTALNFPWARAIILFVPLCVWYDVNDNADDSAILREIIIGFAFEVYW